MQEVEVEWAQVRPGDFVYDFVAWRLVLSTEDKVAVNNYGLRVLEMNLLDSLEGVITVHVIPRRTTFRLTL